MSGRGGVSPDMGPARGWLPTPLDMGFGIPTYPRLLTSWQPLKHVWLASGRYALYWNAFLFLLSFSNSFQLKTAKM